MSDSVVGSSMRIGGIDFVGEVGGDSVVAWSM